MPLYTISIKDYDFSKLKSWYLMIYIEFWAEILFLDSSFNPLSIYTFGSNNKDFKKWF